MRLLAAAVALCLLGTPLAPPPAQAETGTDPTTPSTSAPTEQAEAPDPTIKATGPQDDPAEPDETAPTISRLVVKMDDGSTRIQPVAGPGARETDRQLRPSGVEAGLNVLDLDQNLTVADALELADTIAAQPGVEYAEPDYILTIDDSSLPTLVDPSPMLAAVAAAATPDQYWNQQWNLYDHSRPGGGYSVQAPDAWKVSKGLPAKNGPTPIVAIVDTGITAHPELDGQKVAGYDMVSDPEMSGDGNGRDSSAADPGDWVQNSNRPDWCDEESQYSSWHGTHVAGIVAAASNTAGVTGLAPRVKFQPVRVLGTCGGLSSDIAAGIKWAAGGPVSGVPANKTPADVINVSVGGEGACPSVMQSAINYARSRGAVVVVSAGNSATNIVDIQPANCSGVITVTATNRDGQRAYYSSFGTAGGPVEIAAPGGDGSVGGQSGLILSTVNRGTKGPTTPGYARMQGTSMAAPHVSAIVALIKAKANLTPDAIRARILASATPFPAYHNSYDCNRTKCGLGIANAAGAVAGLTTAPANNSFSQATTIIGLRGSINGRNIAASRETGEPKIGGNDGGASIWYRYQPTRTGVLTVNTTGSTYDTMLGLYSGTKVSALTQRAVNDNRSGSTTTSQIRFNVVKNRVYYIKVDGKKVGQKLPTVGSTVLRWALDS